ncbi:MAG: hypothetical protein FWE16_04205 [Firmicutes bacterium]|nr:hypothetical protein [Bacillota bacterium]
MKKKLIIIIPIIVVIVGISILSSIMFLGWGRSNATEDDFSLTISVRETTVQAGDRIYIDISLKNHTWRAQRISHWRIFCPYIADVYDHSDHTPFGLPFSSRIRKKGVLDTGFWNLYTLRIPNDTKIGEHDLLVRTLFWFSTGRSSYRTIELSSNVVKIKII